MYPGIHWPALNPDLTGTDEVLDEGTAVMTGVSHPDMLQIKEVVRSTYTEPIPFDTQTSESDEYDFGKTVVVQEGADGTEEITRETTYIDGVESSSEVVNYKVLQNPTTQLIVKGTKLGQRHGCPHWQRHICMACSELYLCQPLDELLP